MANTQDISLVNGGENITQRNAQGGLDKTATATFVPYTPPTTITSDNLKTPAPIQVATPTPSTTGAALAGQTQAATDQYTQGLQTASQNAQTTKDTSLGAYTKALAEQKGITTLQGQAEKTAGIDQVQSDLTDVNNQILSEKNSLNHQLVALDAQGGVQSQVNARKEFLTNQSLSKQADLSIIQYAAQNKFDNVKAIADRQAALQFEQQTNNLDALKTTYQDNKDLFTTAEQRAFESAQADRQRTLDQQKADAKTLQDTKLATLRQAQANGASVATLTAIQNAQTPEEVISAGGQTGSTDLLDRQLKQAQINSANRANQPTIGAPTIQKINGVDMQWNPTTQKWIDPATGTEQPKNVQNLANTKSGIDTVDSVLNSSALGSTVGTSVITRSPSGILGNIGATASVVGIPSQLRGAFDSLTGEKQNFIAGVEQIRSNITLDALVNAKKNGATFGALSDSEGKLLSQSGSKLSTWAIHSNPSDPASPVIGYNTSEKNFKQELDKIKAFQKLDYILKGGNAQDVGVTQTPDGKYHTLDSFGNVIEIE